LRFRGKFPVLTTRTEMVITPYRRDVTFAEAERLIEQVRRGDPAAVEAFVTATQPDLWRFLAHLVDPATAEDLAQETYLRALGAVGAFRGDASVRTWLLAIARRVAADELRRRSRRLPTLPLPDEHPGSAGHSGAAEIRDLIRRLPLERREPFVLTQVLGLSYAETANLLGCPLGTVRSRVARARDDLHDALAVAADRQKETR
jgi:RNA polymerase sigma-70 factor (ECF subfamily)